MERIVYRITLDSHKTGIQRTLQGFETADNMARTIAVNITASGDTYEIPLDNVVAMMYVTTPNASEPSINECRIEDNTIYYDVLPIVEEGITEMQIKLIETSMDGAKRVLLAPKFVVEVTESGTEDGSAEQTTTFTALENAIAMANEVYDARLLRVEIDSDCTFRAIYADGTVYENDYLKEALYNGNALLSASYAHGNTGVREGEDTDNSLFYSNVSRSASVEANRVSEEATDLLTEATKQVVYTAFSLDYETGHLEYYSPQYTFYINEETGELEAVGESYSPDDVIAVIVDEWLSGATEKFGSHIEDKNNPHNVTCDQIGAVTSEELEEAIKNVDFSSADRVTSLYSSDDFLFVSSQDGENKKIYFTDIISALYNWFANKEHTHSASDFSAVSRELLWTNSDTVSSFEAQTVSINSLSEYDGIEIVFMADYLDQGVKGTGFIPYKNNGKLTLDCVMVDGTTCYDKRVAVMSSSGIRFKVGNRLTASSSSHTITENNGACIPYKIYGIKGVL